MSGYVAVQTGLVVVFTLVAMYMDVRQHRLPNWLTVPSFVLALLFHTTTGGWKGLMFSLGGFAVGFGILFVLWLIGGGKGGDVKLMGALGAWLGAKLTLFVFLLSPVFAVLFGLTTLGGMVFRDGLSKVKRQMRPAEGSKSKSAGSRGIVPYALPVALSTWLVLIWNFVRP